MEFKVGDKVRILDRVGENSYYPLYTNDMLKYAGTLTTIKEISSTGFLILDNNNYYWDTKAVRLIKEDKYLHPSELKDGDFIKIENNYCSCIYIFKEYKNNIIYRYVRLDLADKSLNTNSSLKWGNFSNSDKITYATEEEKHLLNQALLKEGYVWNNVAKQLQTIDTININNSTGVVDIPKEHCVSSWVSAVNPCHIPSHPKYGVFVDTNKEELNLFPTKRHYQLNFNY